MNRLFACTALLLAASPAMAADANGYTAQYECRAHNPNCDVDIAALVAQDCQETITVADSAATINQKINGGSRFICVHPGDYSAKGRVTISKSGSSSARKVLRYTRVGDNNDVPWSPYQTAGNQATFAGLTIDADYWIVHRLRFNAMVYSNDRNHNIFDRVLIEGFAGGLAHTGGSNSGTVFQNSVFRNGIAGDDQPCIAVGSAFGTGHKIVNNEIYNCSSDGILVWETGQDSQNLVIENNDIYLTSDRYSDGSGRLTPSGNYACAENGMDIKQGGGVGTPIRILHNRVWGFRATDTNCGGGGGGSAGEAIIFHQISNGNGFGLIRNNIIMDGTIAIASPNGAPDHWSIVGNLVYDFRGLPGYSTYAYDQKNTTNVEVYLNTFIKTSQMNSAGWIWAGDNGHDIRCNVAIGGGSTKVSSKNTTQIDRNYYYNTTSAGEANGGSLSVKTRANSTFYSVGDIIRTSSSPQCTSSAPNDTCFYYRVTSAGQTAPSKPTYCTTPGCTTVDGAAVLQAVRGPYTFWRRLRTNPELAVIPFAVPYLSAPESGKCVATIGDTKGIGINDDLLF